MLRQGRQFRCHSLRIPRRNVRCRTERQHHLRRKSQKRIDLMPAGKLLALLIMDLGRDGLPGSQIGRRTGERLIACHHRLPRLSVAAGEQFTVLASQGKRAVCLNDVHAQQPYLSYGLPFLPEDLASI